jgi:nitrate reductase assembly molybdenum cofactor insertion protein NarJ
MKDISHYTLLAEMFRYPYPGQALQTQSWEQVVSAYGPEFLYKIRQCVRHFCDKSLSFQQEYYISTFDVQALCYLDIGYVLFGEDYQRGLFLVHMKKEQEMAENACGSELPDHLPNILTLLPKLKEPGMAEEMICSLLIPALHKMILSFHADNNVYKDLLAVLVKIMETDFPVSEFEAFDLHTNARKDFQGCSAWDQDSGSRMQ